MTEVVLRRATILRFLLFLVIVTGMVFYVVGRREEFRQKSGSGRGMGEEPVVYVAAVADDLGDLTARDFFVEFRMERERTRSQQVEWLRQIINNPNSDTDVRKDANHQLLRLTREIGREMEIESLVRAKGYEDVLVFLFENSAMVIVKAPSLKAEDVSRIGDIVARATGFKMDAISIMSKEQ